uniref:restriction endonuclease subunit S n=1 Tax=uncultured Halomonas sp. TaxID=173971 RepID=UPI002612CA7F
MLKEAQFPMQKLGEVVEILDHLRIPVNSEARDKRRGDVPYYGANGLQGWIDKPLFNEPLILMAEDGGNFDDFSTRPIAYRIDGPAWVNNHAHIIKSENPNLHSFIYWSVAHKDIRKHVAGGTRQKLNQSALKEIEIPWPPEDEGKIVGIILDTLDTQIQKTEALIAKLEKVKEGLLHDLLTRGIDKNGQLRPTPEQAPELYKESPLGLIPKEWRTEALDSLVSDCYRYLSYYGIEYVEDGVKEVRGELIKKDGSLESNESSYRKISETTARRFSRVKLKEGDIVATVRGTIGKFAIANVANYGSVITANLLKISPNLRSVKSEWLLTTLMSRSFQDKLDAACSSTTIKTIQAPELLGLALAVPELEEQSEVLVRVNNLSELIDTQKQELSKLNGHKAGLMDDLLTGR